MVPLLKYANIRQEVAVPHDLLRFFIFIRNPLVLLNLSVHIFTWADVNTKSDTVFYLEIAIALLKCYGNVREKEV